MAEDSPFRVIFFGTPEFAIPTLGAMYDDERFIIEAIVSQPDRPKGRGRIITHSPVKLFANSHYIPLLQPLNAKDSVFINNVKELNPDFILVAAYGQILSRTLLDIAKVGAINIHASLLPKYRGATPIQRAIINGEKETGISFMLMSEKMDQGDILTAYPIEITEDDNSRTLHDKLANLAAEKISDTLYDFAHSKISPTPQDHSLARYANKIEKHEIYIDWNQNAKDIINKIRAFYPIPGMRTSFKNRQIKIYVAEYSDKHGGSPGTVIKSMKKGIIVSCGEGSIIIKNIQAQDSRSMDVSEFLKGTKIEPKDRFETIVPKTDYI